MHDKCGIFAIYDIYNINHLMIKGLSDLQHRGHDSAGISYLKNDNIKTFKNIGLVKNIFHNFDKNYNTAIGHVRYSTIRKTSIENKLKETQPIDCNNFSLAHNGNIPNISKLKEKYKINYQIESDTIILTLIIQKLLLKYNQNWTDTLIEIIHNINGVYCIVIITNNEIYAIRDSFGVRPLCIGKNDTGYCISSESCAMYDYKLIRDIRQGEIVRLYEKEEKILCETIYKNDATKLFCSFEYIYFMKDNSIHNERRIENIRYQLGYELGLKEKYIDKTSIVLSIPNTANASARGFSISTDLEFRNYITKNNDIGRTFILPTNEERITACNNKFIFNPLLKNMNVYIVDDSIVRGNTLKSVIKKLKEIGVNNIHLRISSPKVISECYYGIDIPTKEELIAHNKCTEDIRKELNSTSLKYLDINTMKNIFNQNNDNVCCHCFDTNYNKTLLDW